MRTVSQQIQALLDARSISVAELGRLTGIEKGQLSRIVNGQNAAPGIALVGKIARALNASIDWIYDESAPRDLHREPDEDFGFDFPPGTPEAVRLAVHEGVLAERKAHYRALIPYWRGRYESLLESTKR